MKTLPLKEALNKMLPYFRPDYCDLPGHIIKSLSEEEVFVSEVYEYFLAESNVPEYGHKLEVSFDDGMPGFMRSIMRCRMREQLECQIMIHLHSDNPGLLEIEKEELEEIQRDFCGLI